MNWNKDMAFKVILTDDAREQLQNILDYLFFELNNVQAAYNVEQDMKQTTRMLSHIAASLKLCDTPRLRDLGYRTIHLKRHNYFMLYRIQGDIVYVDAIYHDLQDYENISHKEILDMRK